MNMEKKRTAISAGELYVILDREFRLRQSRECGTCYILLPYRVDADGSNGNWEIVLPPPCAYNCAAILEELVDEYSRIYDLAADNGD
jgi:hypothetical protein